jgi:hypothetical protein
MPRGKSEYVPQSADTDVEADRLQFRIYASWTPAQKLARMQELWDQGRALSLAGLRLRYPQASEDELFLREAALRLGDELMVKVYGKRYTDLAR